MYRTCLFCTQDLGHNEVIEWLPVGRRLAFDASQGRLWVVCRKCERWNLVPFDTRLEAIDACERLFRSARLRYSTDNIGIARLDEGLELVRIGPAQLPEFAAWRYGDQFGKRRRRAAILGVGASVAGVGMLVGGAAVGAVLGLSTGLYYGLGLGSFVYSHGVVVARIPPSGSLTGGALSRSDLATATLHRGAGDEWALEVVLRPSGAGPLLRKVNSNFSRVWLRGEQANHALTYLMPVINSMGAARQVIQDAVTLVPEHTTNSLIMGGTHWQGHSRRSTAFLRTLPASARLAIEMMTHEESERAVLAGDLKLLERQWREADALAKIVDTLTLSAEETPQVSSAHVEKS